MKKLLSILVILLFPTMSFSQTCETSIDGHSVCDFYITDYYGLTSAPALSTAGTVRQYFDIPSGKWKCSQDGGAYTDCIGGGGGGGANSLTDLTDVNTATALAGRILVADGTDFESMALQGDCTLNGAGFITCTGTSIGNCFEVDGSGDLQPVLASTCSDSNFETDGSGDIQPKA